MKNTYPPRLQALQQAVETRNWVLVDMALESLAQSLTKLVGDLVGTSEVSEPPKAHMSYCRRIGVAGNGCTCGATSPRWDEEATPRCESQIDRDGDTLRCSLDPDHEGFHSAEKVLPYTWPAWKGMPPTPPSDYLGMTSSTDQWAPDFTKYDACPICEAQTGEPCKTLPGQKQHWQFGTWLHSIRERLTDWSLYAQCGVCWSLTGVPCGWWEMSAPSMKKPHESRRLVKHVPTATTPPTPATDWNKYATCGWCDTGSPRKEPRGSRNLISQEQGSVSQVVDEAPHSHPPVPTPPHLQFPSTWEINLQDRCPRCGKDLRGGGEFGHWNSTGKLKWCTPNVKVSEPDSQESSTYDYTHSVAHHTIDNKTINDNGGKCPIPACVTTGYLDKSDDQLDQVITYPCCGHCPPTRLFGGHALPCPKCPGGITQLIKETENDYPKTDLVRCINCDKLNTHRVCDACFWADRDQTPIPTGCMAPVQTPSCGCRMHSSHATCMADCDLHDCTEPMIVLGRYC